MYTISYSAAKAVRVLLITLYAFAGIAITRRHTERRRRSIESFSRDIHLGKNMAKRILIERRMKMTGEEKYRFLCRMIEKIPDMRNINAANPEPDDDFELGFSAFYDNVITVIELIDNEGSINGN